MAENIISKINLNKIDFSLDAAKLGGVDASLYQKTGNMTQTIDEKSTSSQYPSASAVYGAISALPTAMQFKGSLGKDSSESTITELPEASTSNAGFVYKVIADGTYQGVVCKTGDTLISNGSSWILIPSGDEPSGTVTSIGITMNGESKGVITSSGNIDLGTVLTSHQDISGKQDVSNLVTALSSSNTDAQYPSAKAVYDVIIENERITAAALNNLETNKQSVLTAGSNISISGSVISATDTVYTHPSYTSKTNGLYKITVDGTGHISAATAVSKADITGLGIPSTNTTYGVATASTNGLMSSSDKSKLDGMSAVTSESVAGWGFTKNTGTVTNITIKMNNSTVGTITSSGVIDLGTVITVAQDIPDISGLENASNKVSVWSSEPSDTKYPSEKLVYNTIVSNERVISAALNELNTNKQTKLSAGSNITISGSVISATDTVYTHPSYTSKTNGLYKITVDGTGHISAATAVSKSDITGLGIPSQDTTYSVATSSTNGLMSSSDKEKLDGISSPMQFKGTLGTDGTITTLPSATSKNKGYAYKVITAGTYQSVACEVGDLLVSNGSTWVLIPSGDEPDGTVTSVAVKMNGTVKGTITTSGTIDLGTVLISHQDISGKQDVSNLVTALSSGSTDTQYPSAKCVYDVITENEEIISESINELDDNKVDKVTGKGLSTNDYTTSEKTKLSGIAEGATNVTESTVSGWGFTKNTGTVTSVAVKMNNTVKGTITTSGTIDLGTVITSDTLSTSLSGYQTKLSAGSNISISGSVISATDTTYSNATTSVNGLMSSSDKSKLDGIASGATANTGTVTSVAVKMNNTVKGTITTSGTIDLGTVLISHQDISGKQDVSNLVTALSSTNTDAQYPSAKAVYDVITDNEEVTEAAINTLNSGKQDKSNLVTSLSSTSTDTQYPSAKCVYDLIGDIESALATIIGD